MPATKVRNLFLYSSRSITIILLAVVRAMLPELLRADSGYRIWSFSMTTGCEILTLLSNAMLVM
jgi:hypothetical protein